MFESIPDGISFKTRGEGRVGVWVNHETSVPFPVPAVPVAINDFTNAMLSEISLNQHSGGFLKGNYAIPSEATSASARTSSRRPSTGSSAAALHE